MCLRWEGSLRFPFLNSLRKREITLSRHIFLIDWWKKKEELTQEEKLDKDNPPIVVERWKWGLFLRSLPKVWIARKIPGRKPLDLDSCMIIWAAKRGILLRIEGLNTINFQRESGTVKVICCQIVRGRVLNLDLIQLSVAFLPQEGHNLDLQEWGTLRVCLQKGQIK